MLPTTMPKRRQIDGLAAVVPKGGWVTNNHVQGKIGGLAKTYRKKDGLPTTMAKGR